MNEVRGRWEVKLTTSKVQEIRRRRAEEGLSMRTLAAEYGVGRTTIQDLLKRRSWRNVA